MKSLKFLLIVLLLTSTFTLFACDSTAPPFEDITWVMESYGERESLKVALPDAEVTLFFDSTNKQFSGNTNCNDYFGHYKVEDRKLSLPEGVAITELRCRSEEIGRQEEEYIGLFSMVDSYQIDNGKLRLNCDHQVIYYRSEQAP